jgi:phosphoribosyl-ATP pyrophosphohydrolase/phosphoribosyl-AMP cyclohydrolase/histidinol dehydrogenase
MTSPLRTISSQDLPARAIRLPVPRQAIDAAARIVEDTRQRGWDAVAEWSRKLGDADPVVFDRSELRRAPERIDPISRGVLEEAAARIRTFAQVQRESIREVEIPIDAGAAGQWLVPVERAGCYAPGGRFRLPSTVLMTVIPARVAGVSNVVVASPQPTDHTLAAAAIANADALVSVGGAQAIAAMAFGAGPFAVPCDIIVGPGNRYVTAAKQLLVGTVGIDMLAGPSELLVLADDSAPARLVAADLLAQAEHDDDARANLLTDSASLIEQVNRELVEQLSDLPTAGTARSALAGSFAVKCSNLDECIEIASRIAPEHLEVMTRVDPREVARRVRNFGAAFLSAQSAEVFGDYGAGPNHVLPTGGTARFASGLSVFTFLNARTWMRIDSPDRALEMQQATARFARIEGLEAHARAAEARGRTP